MRIPFVSQMPLAILIRTVLIGFRLLTLKFRRLGGGQERGFRSWSLCSLGYPHFTTPNRPRLLAALERNQCSVRATSGAAHSTDMIVPMDDRPE